jgi:hypothetical protein
MMEPSSNAGEVSVKPGTAGAAAGGACAFAGAETAAENTRIAQIVMIRVNFILLFSPFEFSRHSIPIAGHPVMYAGPPLLAML